MKSFIIDCLTNSITSMRQYKLVQFRSVKTQEEWDYCLDTAIKSLVTMKGLVKDNE